MANYTVQDDRNDGIDRRGFLKCMAWVGTGTFCVMTILFQARSGVDRHGDPWQD